MNYNALISKADAIQICKSNVPNTNPDFYNLRSKAGYGSWMHSNGEVCAITNIEIEIEKLPAVEAAPVVHGEWKWSHGGECSECGFHNSNFDYRYCPMCGAMMDR